MKIKDMVLVSLFIALTAVGAFISLPLGPVSVSLQSLFVILSGLILGPVLGALSQILYIALGLVGLPIFSGASGGLEAVFRPSFGFLIGFIFASYLAGSLYRISGGKKGRNIWLASIFASWIVYFFGLPYMYYALRIWADMEVSLGFIIKFGFLIFLPGDIIKIILIYLVGKRILVLRKED